jgi:hypothetical protein
VGGESIPDRDKETRLGGGGQKRRAGRSMAGTEPDAGGGGYLSIPNGKDDP